MNSKVYKWCAVPLCTNTSIKTPSKLFVYVPNKKPMRYMWLNLARRDPALVSLNSPIYFCEDHFDLPNDMDNYIQYLVMGSVSQVRMKPGCVPTKFECQPDRKKRTPNTVAPPYFSNKRRKRIVEESEKDLELKEDMENYVKFKLVGGRLKLKKGVLPHKFECQQPPKKNITREEVQTVKIEVTEVLAPILEHFSDLLPDVEEAPTSPVHTEVVIKEELDIEENDPLQQLEMRQAGVGAADVGCAGDARRDGYGAPVAGTSQLVEAWPFEAKFTETFIKNEIDPDEEENEPSLTPHTVNVKSEPVEYEVNIKEEPIVPRKRKRKAKGQNSDDLDDSIYSE